MSHNYEKLKKLLAELFQLDQAELDFGIYRIMNQKRGEIMQFLDSDLLPQVKEAFSHYQSADKAELQKELNKLVANIESAGMDPDQSPKVKELRLRLADAVDVTALENEVFSDLYSFFRRYYDKGDFISARRYKEGVYAIPYEGEEVKLYWANHDQHYIKTSEYFHNYSFKLPSGRRVCFFKLVEADVEKENVKAEAGKERRFILSGNEPLVESNDELVIRFEYKPDSKKRDQKSLNDEAVKTILAVDGFKEWRYEFAQLRPTEKNPNRTLLEQHFNDYTARNTFDYFIHKDLSKFLRRELDFFIKNEVMHLDDIEDESTPRVEQYLSKIKVIRKIAHKIIEFLAQIEDFQKKLWLKKKFVVETNYCVTLDRVPAVLYPDIITNDAQHDEWIKLFAIDEIQGNLHTPAYSNHLTVEFLKANPFLMLDTKFFNQEFKDKLIASFENLDEQCDGLLIHSENFQALNLLQKRYQGCISCVYLDPPYNAKSSEILYKNSYKHSSWLSLMYERLSLGKRYLAEEFVQIIAIDEVEQEVLGQIISQVFPDFSKVGISIVHNPRGQQGKNVSYVHDFAYFIYPRDDRKYIADVVRSEIDSRNLRDSGTESDRTDAKTCFYPFIVKDGKIINIGDVPSDDFHPDSANIQRADGTTEIWPIDESGDEKKWRYSVNSIHKILDKLEIKQGRNTLQVIFNKDTSVMRTVWADPKYDASEYGTKVLQAMLGKEATSLFSYPKSIYTVRESIYAGLNENQYGIVLDYFAGSGTTGHAVINLNREDGGNRKYILVEMGNYFDTVLKPRIQKVIYSKDWKDGKPVSREGSSHLFKYIRLESYEDTLNNLEVKRTDAQQSLLAQSASFRESYMLSYMLDVESRGSLLNVKAFDDPFNYKLNISTGSVGETKPVAVDLVETFNYLIGLTVKHIDTIRGIKVIEGTNPKVQRTLVLWRNIAEMDNDKLDAWFKKQKYNTKDMEYDLIYVNGDNNLENLRREDMTWKVRLIEEEFHCLMFDIQDV